MCAVVTSKREAGEAVVESNHGDEPKKQQHTVQLDLGERGATNCIMATAQMSLMFYQNGEEEKVGINTAALVSFHQVHDGK